jgi:hypothetical protein
LVGVSKYEDKSLDLPLCKNDLIELKKALIKGLNVDKKNIVICGTNGIVTKNQLIQTMEKIIKSSSSGDTIILYFTGHGGKGCLCLSDGRISTQKLINLLDKIRVKNKIIILDSCHSGDFSITTREMDIVQNVNDFAGHGCAVLASCGSEESSGFNNQKRISLYTGFLCEALTSQFLIKRGKKSLEDINFAVFQYAEAWNRKRECEKHIQRPIFRSNIGGTIFFEVAEYNPYIVATVYEETEKYIIYSVEPSHHSQAKRLSAKVILRFESSQKEIVNITKEVVEKIRYYEIHQNKIAEEYHKGKSANIIWCFFGYDEDDMINSIFIGRTTWVDATQDKKDWYKEGKHSKVIKNIHFESFPFYSQLKSFNQENQGEKKQIIEQNKECTAKLITLGERYINLYREYLNNTITEEILIEKLSPFHDEATSLYFAQGDIPYPPKELHEWRQLQVELASHVHNFSLYYNKEYSESWPQKNRMFLMNASIKEYEICLEKLKKYDL